MPTTTVKVSPGVTANVPVTLPPAPPLSVPLPDPPPPPAPFNSTLIEVTPAGTV